MAINPMQAGSIVQNGINDAASKQEAANFILKNPALYGQGDISAAQAVLSGGTGNTVLDTPDASTTVATTAPTGGKTYAPLNTGAVNNTQIAIDQLPSILQAALEAERQSHDNTIGNFNAAEGQQRETYGKSTDTNQMNYDANFMDSVRAGIKGFGGLLNMLRGTGAAGGTAEDQVRDVVGGVTSNDIRNGADTQQANQGQLDSSFGTFLTDLKGKRQVAEDTFTNNNRAIQRDNGTQMQDLLTKMAGYYGDAGDTTRANDFMGRAGALTPAIAGNTKTAVSAYDTTPVAVQAPQLTAFAAPTQPNVASVPQDGQVGSGIFTMNRRKTQDTTPIALPVGA